MECNKEEAVRAKEEAEKKLQHKEFADARRLALRAQCLDPSLENVSQLLLVCNVHCSAEQRLFGNEINWYGILQIEQTADEVVIKKQYRKLALQLHPDKNKFSGAEAAFKLIGEAQTLLLDPNKRFYHDMKRKVSPAHRALQTSTWKSNVKFAQSNFSGVNHQHHPQQPTQQGFSNIQNNVQNNFSSVNRQQYQPKQPAQPGYPNGLDTFWTKCSFCLVRYEYYRTVVNKSLTCRLCKKTFIAVDIGQSAAPTSTNHSQSAPCQQKDIPNRAGSAAGMKFEGNARSKKCEAENFQKTGNCSRDSSGKVNNKRRTQVRKLSKDDDTDGSCDSEDVVDFDDNGNLNATNDFGPYGEYPRRSTRQKQKVSYNEPLSDDDGVASSPKRAKVGHSVEEGSGEALKQGKIGKKRQLSAHAGVKCHRGIQGKAVASEGCLPNENRETKKMSKKEVAGEDCSKEGLEADNDSSASDVQFFACPKPKFELDPVSLPSDIGKVDDPEDLLMRAGKIPADTCESVSAFQTKAKSSSNDLKEGIEVPDPEFHNFDDERSIKYFQVGDIWSIYSDEDSLPKYYCQIRKIYTHSDVTLEIMWLEFFTVAHDTIRWSDRDVPVSCGFFKLKQGIQSYSSTDCFSHRVVALEHSRNLFEILPKMGDIWALYRNWRSDMSCSELGQCEYDIVQVNRVNDTTFDVLALERVSGFNTVFKPCLDGGSPVARQVYHVELFRFSHQIPAFQLSDESNGSLRGYWVLDPSAFPVSFFSSK